MDQFEGDENVEVVVDTHTFDCADFFCASVTRHFPDVSAQVTFPLAWRPSWVFTVGPHDETRKLDELCRTLQEKIFWDQSVLIGYTIQQEGDSVSPTEDYSGL